MTKRAPPRLPASAFAPLATPTVRKLQKSTLDSHLSGTSSLKVESIDGFILVLQNETAVEALKEIESSLGGLSKDKLKGIIATVSVEALNEFKSYSSKLEESVKSLNIKVVGVLGARVRITDNTNLLDPTFINALKVLGQQQLAVDFLIDSSNSTRSLNLIFDCITLVREGQDELNQTRFIIDHLGSPIVSTLEVNNQQSKFTIALFNLSLLPQLFIKLSGFLPLCDSVLVKSSIESSNSKELKTSLKVYLEPVLEAFGESRILFGSGDDCLEREFQSLLFRETLLELGVVDEGLDSIFEGTSRFAYTTSCS